MPSLAAANPADVLGFGSRAAAMGGAATALADDASANYYNPAGLVRGDDLRIDVGYQVGLPHLKLNGNDSGVDPIHGLAVGVVAPGRLGPVRLAFGAALFLPDDRLTRLRALAFAQPRWVYYDNRPQRILLTANLAVQIVPGLYVGAGLSFMSRTQGTVELRGRIGVTDDSALVTSTDVNLLAIRYPEFGVSWDVTRWLTVAASYRHSFVLSVDQAFAISGDVGNQGKPPIIQNGSLVARSVSSDLFQPWQLTVAFAARLTRRLTLAFDATYARWSEFQTPAAVFDLKLDVGPTFNDKVHLPKPSTFPAPGFHDVLSPRVGLEWRAADRLGGRERLGLHLRAGYAYEPSPAPEQTGDSNYADCDKHTFSVGAGLELGMLGPILPRPLSIDVHFALVWLPTRYNRKIDPLDPTGDFAAGGNVEELGVTTRWRF